jgi:phosphoenolpyruvate carboxykinase (GTP)
LQKLKELQNFLMSQEEMPDKVFEVLEEQKKRLEKAREKFGDYISPLEFIK